jgi:hypothetical protein
VVEKGPELAGFLFDRLVSETPIVKSTVSARSS